MKTFMVIATLLTTFAVFTACNNENTDNEKGPNDTSDTTYRPQPDPYSPHPTDTTRRDTTTY